MPAVVRDHRLRPWQVDLGVAAATACITTVGVWQEVSYDPGSQPWAGGAYLFGATACALLVFRRRRPLATALSCLAMVLGYHLAGYAGAAPAMATFVAVYSVSSLSSSRWGLLPAVLVGLAAPAVVVLPPHSIAATNPGVYGPALGLVVFALAGEGARTRSEQMQDHLALRVHTAAEEGRRKLAEERIRIARELHDIVAHTVAVIAVQASVAVDALDTRPDDARAALAVIRRAARDANAELQATVGVLRAGDDRRTDHSPAPGLHQLEDLVRRLPSLAVAVQVDGEDRLLPRPVDLAAYRIAQEALTNVVRHTDSSSALVVVRYDPTGVTIEVANPGKPRPGIHQPSRAGYKSHERDPEATIPSGPRSRFGLLGMRERAMAVGGTLSAGPLEDGGFRVLAFLPRQEPSVQGNGSTAFAPDHPAGGQVQPAP